MKWKNKTFILFLIIVMAALLTVGVTASQENQECCAGQHKVVYTITCEPTCTQTGEKSGVCSVCGEFVRYQIAETGHEYTEGVCKICGMVEGEKRSRAVMKNGTTQGTLSIKPVIRVTYKDGSGKTFNNSCLITILDEKWQGSYDNASDSYLATRADLSGIVNDATGQELTGVSIALGATYIDADGKTSVRGGDTTMALSPLGVGNYKITFTDNISGLQAECNIQVEKIIPASGSSGTRFRPVRFTSQNIAAATTTENPNPLRVYTETNSAGRTTAAMIDGVDYHTEDKTPRADQMLKLRKKIISLANAGSLDIANTYEVDGYLWVSIYNNDEFRAGPYSVWNAISYKYLCNIFGSNGRGTFDKYKYQTLTVTGFAQGAITVKYIDANTEEEITPATTSNNMWLSENQYHEVITYSEMEGYELVRAKVIDSKGTATKEFGASEIKTADVYLSMLYGTAEVDFYVTRIINGTIMEDYVFENNGNPILLNSKTTTTKWKEIEGQTLTSIKYEQMPQYDYARTVITDAEHKLFGCTNTTATVTTSNEKPNAVVTYYVTKTAAYTGSVEYRFTDLAGNVIDTGWDDGNGILDKSKQTIPYNENGINISINPNNITFRRYVIGNRNQIIKAKRFSIIDADTGNTINEGTIGAYLEYSITPTHRNLLVEIRYCYLGDQIVHIDTIDSNDVRINDEEIIYTPAQGAMQEYGFEYAHPLFTDTYTFDSHWEEYRTYSGGLYKFSHYEDDEGNVYNENDQAVEDLRTVTLSQPHSEYRMVYTLIKDSTYGSLTLRYTDMAGNIYYETAPQEKIIENGRLYETINTELCQEACNEIAHELDHMIMGFVYDNGGMTQINWNASWTPTDSVLTTIVVRKANSNSTITTSYNTEGTYSLSLTTSRPNIIVELQYQYKTDANIKVYAEGKDGTTTLIDEQTPTATYGITTAHAMLSDTYSWQVFDDYGSTYTDANGKNYYLEYVIYSDSTHENAMSTSIPDNLVATPYTPSVSATVMYRERPTVTLHYTDMSGNEYCTPVVETMEGIDSTNTYSTALPAAACRGIENIIGYEQGISITWLPSYSVISKVIIKNNGNEIETITSNPATVTVSTSYDERSIDVYFMYKYKATLTARKYIENADGQRTQITSIRITDFFWNRPQSVVYGVPDSQYMLTDTYTWTLPAVSESHSKEGIIYQYDHIEINDANGSRTVMTQSPNVVAQPKQLNVTADVIYKEVVADGSVTIHHVDYDGNEIKPNEVVDCGKISENTNVGPFDSYALEQTAIEPANILLTQIKVVNPITNAQVITNVSNKDDADVVTATRIVLTPSMPNVDIYFTYSYKGQVTINYIDIDSKTKIRESVSNNYLFGTQNPNIKVNVPQTIKNSEEREYELVYSLASNGGYPIQTFGTTIDSRLTATTRITIINSFYRLGEVKEKPITISAILHKKLFENGTRVTEASTEIKSGYGLYATVITTGPVTQVTASYRNQYGILLTIPLEKLGDHTTINWIPEGETYWQFSKNNNYPITKRKLYVPLTIPDNVNYEVTFICYKSSGGTNVKAAEVKSQILVKGNMYEDDFTAAR